MKQVKEKIYKNITAEEIKNIDESWGVCDPMFRSIICCEGYEKYLKTSEIFTLEQRYLCAIHWYFGEVINGGHHQFFYNSTGVV